MGAWIATGIGPGHVDLCGGALARTRAGLDAGGRADAAAVGVDAGERSVPVCALERDLDERARGTVGRGWRGGESGHEPGHEPENVGRAAGSGRCGDAGADCGGGAAAVAKLEPLVIVLAAIAAIAHWKPRF